VGGVGLRMEVAGAFTNIGGEFGASTDRPRRIPWLVCDCPERGRLPLALPLCRRNITARAQSRKVHCRGLRRVVKLASLRATETISKPFLVPWTTMP